MKSFVISAIIFCLLLGVILLNYCYVLRVCNELEEKIDALPDCSTAGEAVREMIDFFEKESRKLKLSLPLRQLDKMEECLADLSYASTFGDARIFEESRFRAKAIIKDIHDGEIPRIENWM